MGRSWNGQCLEIMFHLDFASLYPSVLPEFASQDSVVWVELRFWTLEN